MPAAQGYPEKVLNHVGGQAHRDDLSGFDGLQDHESKVNEGTSRAYADRIEVLQALAASDA